MPADRSRPQTMSASEPLATTVTTTASSEPTRGSLLPTRAVLAARLGLRREANSGTSGQLAIDHENGARSFASPEPLQRVHDALERGDVGDDTG
jgi:hypothetical protein